MTSIMLDTSAYSALAEGHPGVAHAVRESEAVCLSAVALGEVLAGFRGGERQRRNEEILRRFLASPHVSVTPIDAETAERYANISTSLKAAGTPIPANDVWIAAEAMKLGVKLLTLDAHFRKVPQILVECFDAP